MTLIDFTIQGMPTYCAMVKRLGQILHALLTHFTVV